MGHGPEATPFSFPSPRWDSRTQPAYGWPGHILIPDLDLFVQAWLTVASHPLRPLSTRPPFESTHLTDLNLTVQSPHSSHFPCELCSCSTISSMARTGAQALVNSRSRNIPTAVTSGCLRMLLDSHTNPIWHPALPRSLALLPSMVLCSCLPQGSELECPS